jgi:hypothetical protein
MKREKTRHRSITGWRHFLTRVFCLCMLCCLAIVAPVEGESQNTNPGNPVWTPAGALPEGFDWVQLTSGEWLKGDLKVLYNDSLEFDSDELNLLTLDWEDVQQVRCHAPQSVRLEEPGSGYHLLDLNKPVKTVEGILRIEGDLIFVDTGEGVLEFDRDSLVSIAPGKSQELDFWLAEITLSLDISKGNSDQLNYSAYGLAKRRTSQTRFFIDYHGIFTQTQGIETANSQRTNSYLDVFSTRRYFWRPIFIEHYRDPFANIAHRGTVGTGVGYTIIDTSVTDWLISPGIAYVGTQFKSTELNEDETISTLSLVISTEFDTELTDKIDFNVNYKLNAVNKESGTYMHNAKASLKIELTGQIDLDLSFVWDRTQDPEPTSDGSVPEQDDLYFFSGITFEL